MASTSVSFELWGQWQKHEKPYKPKSEDTNQEKFYLLHMDLCGPMWVPTRKIFTSSTTKVDCETLNGSNEDITNLYECDQTLNDLLFQPLFDELLNPPSSVDRPAPKVIAPIVELVAPEPAASTGSPSSTTVDQDEPSPSNSQTTPKTQSLVISNKVEEDNYDLDVAHMNNDPFFSIPIPENASEASSSLDVIPTIMHTATPNSEHVTRWTKDHPLDNIIVEPKNYRDALTRACWIEAMQEELHEFEHLEVWELVPHPDKVMVITLKVKLDELGGIRKNKARLVARGYRQE
ncbi:retrovirus-related pol polyprotein from transposon TNT 1-94 [Tanacetum coccineum]